MDTSDHSKMVTVTIDQKQEQVNKRLSRPDSAMKYS